jgi:hypothetical protein
LNPLCGRAVGSDDDEILPLSADCGPESCLLEPAELIGEGAGLVVVRADRRDRILRIAGDDDIGQDEAPARAQRPRTRRNRSDFPASSR